jgi:hypothetical protein
MTPIHRELQPTHRAAGLRLVVVDQALLLCDTAARTLGMHLGFLRRVVPRAVTVVSIPTA